ncbi:MAG TPA: FtsX-like permease family protein [Gemmatimonadaceae bacterium]|nr:FtsX-like permease family protein [Gemmatimonadaceae bacterium]
MFDRIRFRLRALFRSSTLDREMRDEMQTHLDRRVEVLVAGGMSPERARLAARREFGNVGLHQERARDARRTRWIDSVSADIRFALRSFARKPFLAATIVLVLAAGIGAHAFELTLLRRISYGVAPGMPSDIDLVRLRGMWRPKDRPNWRALQFSYPELREMAEVPNTFSSVVAWTAHGVVVDAAGSLDGAEAQAQFVTDGFFSVLGMQPTHGPGLPRATPDPQLVAVISHAMWEDAFDRAGDIANRTVVVNGVIVRIVGVAPPRFTNVLDDEGRRVLWMPLSARATIASGGQTNNASILALSSVDSTLFDAVGVLRRGVSPAEATARVRVIADRAVARMAWTKPTGPSDVRVYDADVVPLRGITDVTSSDRGEESALLGVITTLVLLVACTNVAGLVVSAGVARRQEIAIRLSLGASRARVIRQLVTESVLLASAGGAAGLLLYWSIIAFMAKRASEAAWLVPDYSVVALTMCIALGTGLLCGLTPALHATREGVSETLKGDAMGATPRSRLQHGFVIAQVMLTQPLLVLLGLMIGSLLLNRPPTLPNGIPERVLRITLGSMPGTDAEKSAARQRVEHRISELPGVVSVLAEAEPLDWATLSVLPADRGPLPTASSSVPVNIHLVRPGYFSMLGSPLLRGNDRPPADTSGIITISSDLARTLWGDADPIGRRLVQTSAGVGLNRIFTVTGVFDARRFPSGRGGAIVYRPTQSWWPNRYLIRTAGQVSDLTVAVRRVVREELPMAPIASITTLAEVAAAGMKEARWLQAGAAASGVIVLVLASLGLYGIVALGVAQRRREIGVRMALGARAGQVVQLFYVTGVKLGVLGLALGLPITLVAVKVANSLNPETEQYPSLLLVGGVIATVVFLVASVATLLPATRAATVDPVTALRSE